MRNQTAASKRIVNPDLPIVKEQWQGNYTIDGRFYSDSIVEKPPIWSVLKWKLSRNPQKQEKREDLFSLMKEEVKHLDFGQDVIVWLGHSSFYISINGVHFITDPVLYDIPTASRLVDLPLPDSSINPVNYILLTHDHRDHFDRKSIETLNALNSDIEALIPLGADRLFAGRKLRDIKRQEAGWFQEYVVNDRVRVIFLPSGHWGRRGLFDYNKTLWGSFLIITDTVKIYFCGDSAYGEHFKGIHDIFGDIDICILPIGAYAPDWIMAQSHMNPEESVRAFSDMGGRVFIPSHYGTFDLSDEPLGEPIIRLEQELNSLGREGRLKALSVGEKYSFLSD